ncbi:MAG: helix-turn-helix domain-containing protein [Betaproteobacteria bacterium]|nr:helix-turn-helix domain-containing protein [Betaproteobacteria bacterium]MDE2423773.1 helix-turn-helix domain-containing protein [Betaproteobacteria bacterium]
MTENIDKQASLTFSLGQQLMQIRTEKGYSLNEVSDKLKFSVKQLTYLENDQFEQLLSPYLVRAMLRSYAKFLLVDEQPLIKELERVLPAAKIQSFTSQAVAVQPKSVSFSTAKVDQNKIGIKMVLIGALLVVLLALFFWFQKNYLHHSEAVNSVKPEAESSSLTQSVNKETGGSLTDKQNPAQSAVSVNPLVPISSQPLPLAVTPQSTTESGPNDKANAGFSAITEPNQPNSH